MRASAASAPSPAADTMPAIAAAASDTVSGTSQPTSQRVWRGGADGSHSASSESVNAANAIVDKVVEMAK